MTLWEEAEHIEKLAYGKRMNQKPKLPNLPMKAKKPHVNKKIKKFKFRKYHPKTHTKLIKPIKPKTMGTGKSKSSAVRAEIESLEHKLAYRAYRTQTHFQVPIPHMPGEYDSLCKKGGTTPSTTTDWNQVDCKYCLKLKPKK